MMPIFTVVCSRRTATEFEVVKKKGKSLNVKMKSILRMGNDCLYSVWGKNDTIV